MTATANIAAIHRPKPVRPKLPSIHGSAYGEFWPEVDWQLSGFAHVKGDG